MFKMIYFDEKIDIIKYQIDSENITITYIIYNIKSYNIIIT